MQLHPIARSYAHATMYRLYLLLFALRNCLVQHLLCNIGFTSFYVKELFLISVLWHQGKCGEEEGITLPIRCVEVIP